MHPTASGPSLRAVNKQCETYQSLREPRSSTYILTDLGYVLGAGTNCDDLLTNSMKKREPAGINTSSSAGESLVTRCGTSAVCTEHRHVHSLCSFWDCAKISGDNNR